MTALNTRDMIARERQHAIARALESHGYRADVAMALANSATNPSDNTEPALVAQTLMRLTPREQLDRWLAHEGIIGFTNRLVRGMKNIEAQCGKPFRAWSE